MGVHPSCHRARSAAPGRAASAARSPPRPPRRAAGRARRVEETAGGGAPGPWRGVGRGGARGEEGGDFVSAPARANMAARRARHSLPHESPLRRLAPGVPLAAQRTTRSAPPEKRERRRDGSTRTFSGTRAVREKRALHGNERERRRVRSRRRGLARVRSLGNAPERGRPALRARRLDPQLCGCWRRCAAQRLKRRRPQLRRGLGKRGRAHPRRPERRCAEDEVDGAANGACDSGMWQRRTRHWPHTPLVRLRPSPSSGGSRCPLGAARMLARRWSRLTRNCGHNVLPATMCTDFRHHDSDPGRSRTFPNMHHDILVDRSAPSLVWLSSSRRCRMHRDLPMAACYSLCLPAFTEVYADTARTRSPHTSAPRSGADV